MTIYRSTTTYAHTSPTPAIFFFPTHAHPQHLHSFPTRRSPDQPPAEAAPPGLDDDLALGLRDDPDAGGPVALAPERPLGLDRSEEHTSELQSHSDLVCRLLLEKKKNANLSFVVDNGTAQMLLDS